MAAHSIAAYNAADLLVIVLVLPAQGCPVGNTGVRTARVFRV